MLTNKFIVAYTLLLTSATLPTDLNSKKANRQLKWKPFLNIDKTISLTSDWYLANKQRKDMFKIS